MPLLYLFHFWLPTRDLRNVATLCGLDAREAIIVGMMAAVSSTACVLRLLTDRAEIDSEHGRTALGILLVQDAAVIPMMLLVSVMATGGTWGLIVGKPLLIVVLARAFGRSWRYAIAAALCLAQVGEFSFVLATIAQSNIEGAPLMSAGTFRAMVSATIVTLLLTPYFVAAAPWAGARCEDILLRLRARYRPARSNDRPLSFDETAATDSSEGAEAALNVPSDLILIVGVGPAGQRVAEGLIDSRQQQIVAVDLNPDNIEVARRYGLAACLGDATHRDILEHAGIYRARAVVVTVPDHATTRHLIYMVRDLAPDASIVARCRYHVLHWELLHAGADEVVDEEDQLGRRLAAQTRKLIGTS